jgi:DNA modification methylase
MPTTITNKPRTSSRSKKIAIGCTKTCSCGDKHLNCLTAKDWMKSQLGVWQFFYEKRDIRKKELHPATFPLALAKKTIELFTHQGELIVDPFNGSGTTLLAANDLARNAVGFDINKEYCTLSDSRIPDTILPNKARQIAVCADARHMADYINDNSISFSLTSPPYANLLNRERKNKSRRGDERKNGQYGKVEQYSQRAEDLGTLSVDAYEKAMYDIYASMYPLMKPKGDVIINIADMWWEGHRIPLHLHIINALRNAGYVFKNTIIWDRTNIVNRIGIFGWPSNYITMGTTFEYLLHFYKPGE